MNWFYGVDTRVLDRRQVYVMVRRPGQRHRYSQFAAPVMLRATKTCAQRSVTSDAAPHCVGPTTGCTCCSRPPDCQ